MSFLSIIPQVWGDGFRMLYSFAKVWFRSEALSRTDSASMIMVTGCEKYADLLSPALPCDRSRPDWMTHGFDTSHTYAETEPFPKFLVFDMAECEEAAMHVVHAHGGLLPHAHPLFAPNLTPIDVTSAVKAVFKKDDDVYIHVTEARDALRTVLHFAAGMARSRYQHSHPAFACLKTPWHLYSSPLPGEMMRYLAKTFEGCRNSIRVAPPSQIRLELETCLILAFAPYVLSDQFRSVNGKSTIVPNYFASMLEERSRWDPHVMRDVIYICEQGLVEDGEDLSSLWEAWRWVVKTYVGLLVLRHRYRQKEEIVWV